MTHRPTLLLGACLIALSASHLNGQSTDLTLKVHKIVLYPDSGSSLDASETLTANTTRLSDSAFRVDMEYHRKRVPPFPDRVVTASLTFTAPNTTLTGKEQKEPDLFHLDAPAKFQVATQYSEPEGADETIGLFMGGLYGDSDCSLVSQKSGTAPQGSCTFSNLLVVNPADINEDPAGPKLIRMEGRIDLFGAQHSVLFYAYYDYASCGGGTAVAASASRLSVSALPHDTQPSTGCSAPDAISFVNGGVFPNTGEVFLANAENKTTPFFAVAKYSLNSADAGKVVLQVFDQSGNRLREGTPVLATRGTQNAGGNCTGASAAGNCLFIPAITYADNVTSLSILAVLKDASDKILAKSNVIAYPIVAPDIRMTLGSQDKLGAFTPALPNTALEGGSQIEYSVDNATVEADYDYPGNLAFVSLLVRSDTQGVGRTTAQRIGKGKGTLYFRVGDMKVPSTGTALAFAAIVETSTGQKYQTPPLTVPMETISRGAAAPPEKGKLPVTVDPSNPKTTLPVTVSFPLNYQIGPAGAILTTNFFGLPGEKQTLSPGSGQTKVSFTAFFDLALWYDFTVKTSTTRPDGRCPCAHADTVYYGGLTLVEALPPGPSKDNPVAGGSVSPTQNTTTRKVTSSTSNTDVNQDLEQFRSFTPKPKSATPQEARATTSSASIPDFIGIHRTWQFAPAIPADGSFAATLKLNYSRADLPDDPNFDETKLKIVSFNSATGAFASYDTALDLTNKTASTQVNSLEPEYSLVVIGPFSKSLLNVPLYVAGNSFDTKASIVNTGSADAHLSVNGYAPDGTILPGSPLSPTVTSKKQMSGPVASLGFDTSKAGRSGWLQAKVDGNTVSGIITIGNGTVFDALPLVTGHASSSLLTDIELDDTHWTEIHLVNPATNPRSFTIDLRGSDGKPIGTYSGTLDVKDTLVRRVEDLFPSIAKPFTGYAIVTGDGDIVASELLYSPSTVAAMSGHPLTSQAAGARSLYGAQLGAPGQFTRVILVNTQGSDANATLTAHKPDGSTFGSPVAMKIPAAGQYIADLATVFHFDPGSPQTGWLSVASDQPFVGDLTFGDASFFERTRASVPLSDTPLNNSVLPFAENDATAGTTINISNPNSTAAAVTVATMASNGTQAASSTVNVPGNGFATSTVSAANLASGYVILSSTQPIVAFATVAPASGSDFAAFSAQPIGAGAPPTAVGPAPQISAGVNAASYLAKLARGSLATLFGSNFTTGAPVSASSLPLPFTLGGVSVTVGGVPAPLIYVSSAQINFQVPYEAAAGGPADIVVTSNGSSSTAMRVIVSDYAVGIFTYPRTSQALDPIIVHNATNTLVTPSSPALSNEFLVIYATGVGRLTAPPPIGSGATGLSGAIDTPVITVGGLPVKVLYAGLTPGFPGLVQFNIQLPASLPSGSLPIVIAFPGDSSPQVNLAVQGNAPAAPKLTLSTTSLAFGNVVAGQTKDLTVSVSNTGTAPLTVASVSVSGAGVSLVSASSFTVQPGASQSVTVRFAPASADVLRGTLTLVSNDAASPAVVSLSGTGVASGPAITVTPLSLDFGSVGVGQSSSPKPITITNTGTASATVNLSVGVPFTVSPANLTLAANGGTGTASIIFSPTSATSAAGSLNIIVSGQSTPAASVTLAGLGVSVTAANFAGQWNTDYGAMTLNQNGNAVTGIYPNSGSINGTVSGNILSGTWSDSSGTGTVTFTLSADGNSFSGTWTRLTGSGNPGGPWNGTRVASPPAGAGACIAAPANLVSWWTGDGNGSDSTGGNNLTLQGAATYAAGQVGQAFQFDGNSGYASAGNPGSLKLTTGMTAEAWIYPRNAPSVGNMSAVLTKWAQIANDQSDADSYGLWFRNDATAGLSLFGAIHQSGGREPHVLGGRIPLNTWTHVAFTFDSTTGQMVAYVNGQAVNSLTSPGPITTSSRNVFIGREDSSQPRPFNGLIDEVSVYGRALSASEIQAIFTAGAAGKCKTGSGTSGGGTGNSALPSRPAGAVLDSNNPLSNSLVGLFLMNEGRGTTDLNLADGQSASFAGSSVPTWNTGDPSIVFNGGGTANSFLNAGTDLIFDRLPTSRITIVSKVFVNAVTGAAICEKNDQNATDGILFGFEANGALHFTVEKSGSNMRAVSAPGAVVAGQWMQVAVTWDGGEGSSASAHLFVNGVERPKAGTNDSGSGSLGYAGATNQPFRIGTGSFDTLGSLNGKMAYLAVYRGRILTTAELNQLDSRLPIR